MLHLDLSFPRLTSPAPSRHPFRAKTSHV